MPWTDEQRRAIETRGCNLLLSAAAGSGKTTVLVERVLRLIAEGADVDRMLIVTFTRAAAADMRAKLSKNLNERAAQDRRCREQLMRLERASISTLHAFCADFLRGNFEAAQVDPAFRILDDAENRRLLDEALDEALERAYDRSDEALLALDYGRGPKGVRAAAEQLYAFLQERPEPWPWLEAAQDLEKMLPLWLEELERAARRGIRTALASANVALEQPECPDNYAAALEADRLQLEPLLEAADYEALRLGAQAFRQTKVKVVRGLDEAIVGPVKKLRASAADAIKAVADGLLPLSEARADLEAATPALAALGGIVRDVAELHEAAKREAAGLTYADLEHYTYRALADADTARAVRERYDYIFVDEYQDTSDVQEALVSRICREDNLFMVGDVKQSIYRFRLAEPGLFLQKYVRYIRGDGGQLLPLTRNFRSFRPVLDFTNAVFERVMTGGDAEVEYDELARLNPGSEAQDTGEPVELHIIDGAGLSEPDEDAEADEGDAVEGAQREGALIAERILALKAEDPELRFRDIAILTRSKGSAFEAILPMLAARGIPAYADGAEGFFTSMEIVLLLELLQLIANRRSDVALIGVLRSPVGDLTNEELARVRIASPRTPFLDAALAYAGGTDETARKLRTFFEKLDSWRMRAGTLSLDALTRAVLDESGFYTYAGALPAGVQRQANLDAFVRRAERFDREISGSLTRFLRYTEDMRARGDGDAAHPLGENDDVVRLMTIHRSKGLEFKVVFGARLASRYHAPRNEDTLLAHRDLGIGMQFIDPELRSRRTTLARQAISARAKREDAAEEMRILYVLLTRARERLILTACVRDLAAEENRWKLVAQSPGAASSHLELLMGALSGADQAGLPLRVQIHNADAFRAVQPSEEGRALQALLKQAVSGELPEPEGTLCAAMAWTYPDPAESRKPLKLTASGLLRELEGPEALPPLAPRPRFLGEEGMNAAERGTAYHRALQNLDLRALDGLTGEALVEAVRAQLEEMAACGKLLAEERAAVKPGPLARFLSGETGLRLRRSPEVRREWPFNVMMRASEALTDEEAGEFGEEEILVQGSIDCCFVEDGEWVLLDYKTDRTDDPEALRRHYEKQLFVYALALERITGKRVKERRLCLLASGGEMEIG